MRKKYLVWNTIGILVGLIFMYIGYNAKKAGIETLEVPMPPTRNSLPIAQGIKKSKQDPYSLGIILIVLNACIIFYKVFIKKYKY